MDIKMNHKIYSIQKKAEKKKKGEMNKWDK